MTKEPTSKRWIALAALCVAVFMSLLDVTIVNVALPTIQHDLNETFSDLQWIINAYTLAYAAFLLLAAKLGDIFGRKRLFLIELVIFTAGSLASALSQTSFQLNLFRAMQGLGGAGMMTLSMAIVATTFHDRERGVAFGIWSSVIGFATAIGPLLGGWLIQTFSWRAIFLINVPVGLLAILVAIFFVDESRAQQSERIDWLGMIISIAMIFLLVYGLVQKETHAAWTWFQPQVAGYLVGGVALLIVFIVLEQHLQAPMVDLTIFKSVSFDGTILAAFCLGAALYSFFTYLTVWMQNYLGYSAMQTGIRQLAISLFSLILGPVAGALTNRIQKRWLIGAGLFLIAGGLLVINQAVSIQTTYLSFVGGFVLLGIGNAIVNPPLSSAAMDSVAIHQVGIASGVLNVFRQLGISFGIVILGLRMSAAYNPAITHQFAKLPLPQQAVHGITHALQQAGPISGNVVLKGVRHTALQYPNGGVLMHKMSNAVFAAFNTGFRSVLMTAIAFALIGGLAAVFFIRDRAKNKM
ncbi:MAG TPA: MFS transporter [Lactobacillus sp.]|nr:MFS transporter [Lactobacillus sp.]